MKQEPDANHANQDSTRQMMVLAKPVKMELIPLLLELLNASHATAVLNHTQIEAFASTVLLVISHLMLVIVNSAPTLSLPPMMEHATAIPVHLVPKYLPTELDANHANLVPTLTTNLAVKNVHLVLSHRISQPQSALIVVVDTNQTLREPIVPSANLHTSQQQPETVNYVH